MDSIYRFRQWSLTILRVVLSLIFIYHGYLKLFVPGGFTGTVSFLGYLGFPAPVFSALVLAIIEFAGGIFLLVGFLTKWSSLVLLIDMLVALFTVHLHNGFLIANGGFEFVVLLALSLAVILLNGPGSLSIDRLIFKDDEEKNNEKISNKSSKKAKVASIDGSGVIARIGISKEPGYLYFLDKKGDVARVQMARRGEKTSKKHEVLAKLGVKRKQGYLYYIDSHGNVAQARMARG